MDPKIVVIGSGISGLLSALLLSRKHDGANLYLVDKNKEPGGLLRRFDYGIWGDFDYGMHNMLETGIRELDELLWELLPAEEWQLLKGDHRDLAGIYFNGALQTNTPYVDLRNLSKKDFETCLAALFEHFADAGRGRSDSETTMNVEQYAISRFGKTVAEKTIIPSIEKIHRRKASELDYMATLLTPMARLAFCDEPLVAEITASEFLRDRIAWGDQRTLPLERSSGRNAFYPANYGIYRVVDALLELLNDAGVHLLMETEITGVRKKDGQVTALDLQSNGETSAIDGVDHLIWTTNIPLLGRMLGTDFSDLKYDKPLKTIVVNLVLDRLPEHLEDLYYFFCYDSRFNTFRVTNFTNYCRGAPRNGGYPVSLEMLMEEDEVAGADLEDLAIDEYHRLEVSHPDTQVLFAKAEILDNGFPMPSVNNVHALRRIRDDIRAMQLSNLDMVGILAEDNLFFQTDVLADVFTKLN